MLRNSEGGFVGAEGEGGGEGGGGERKGRQSKEREMQNAVQLILSRKPQYQDNRQVYHTAPCAHCANGLTAPQPCIC